MEKHYNFENSEKGKFFIAENEIQLPIYLDFNLQNTIIKIADEKNKSYSDTINELIRDDIKINYPNSFNSL
jgi:hypothetical protein